CLLRGAATSVRWGTRWPCWWTGSATRSRRRPARRLRRSADPELRLHNVTDLTPFAVGPVEEVYGDGPARGRADRRARAAVRRYRRPNSPTGRDRDRGVGGDDRAGAVQQGRFTAGSGT